MDLIGTRRINNNSCFVSVDLFSAIVKIGNNLSARRTVGSLLGWFVIHLPDLKGHWWISYLLLENFTSRAHSISIFACCWVRGTSWGRDSRMPSRKCSLWFGESIGEISAKAAARLSRASWPVSASWADERMAGRFPKCPQIGMKQRELWKWTWGFTKKSGLMVLLVAFSNNF